MVRRVVKRKTALEMAQIDAANPQRQAQTGQTTAEQVLKGREQARQAARVVPQVDLQREASQQGVPVEALIPSSVSKKNRQAFLANRPIAENQVSLEQAQEQRAGIVAEEQTLKDKRDLATSLATGETPPENVEGLTAEQIRNADIFNPKTPQEVFNPDNTLGGGLKATALVAGTAAGVALASTIPLAGVLGRISGTTKLVAGAAGISSLSALFSVFTGKRKQGRIEEDIREIDASLNGVLRSVKLGADPQQAVEKMDLIEAQIIKLSGELHLALLNDPSARLAGEDTAELLAKYIERIAVKRYAVQVYARTKDPTLLDDQIKADLQEE